MSRTQQVGTLCACLIATCIALAAEGENCAVASVRVLCQLSGIESSEEQLTALRRACPDATASMADIQGAAALVGVQLRGVRATLSALGEVRGPRIAHLRDGDSGHFVVLARLSTAWAQLLEHGRPVVVSREEIEKRYSGHALILEQSVEDTGGPRLQLDEFHHSFGVSGIGQEVSHAFTVSNAGDEDLVFGLQPQGCGPPATIGKDSLAPGESTEVTVKFTVSFSGSVMQSVMLFTNDLTQPVAFVTVHGKVPHDLRAYPDRLFLSGTRQDTLSRSITVSGPAEMDLGSVNSARSLLDIQVRGPEVHQDEKKTWSITLLLKPDTLVGEFTDELSIPTTHEERPLITIPIRGMIRGDLEVMPPSAFFGFVEKGEQAGATLVLINRTRTPFRLLGITPSDPRIEVTQSETEGGYSLAVSVPTDKLGVFEGEVVVTTDIPLEETISIPVYVHVVE